MKNTALVVLWAFIFIVSCRKEKQEVRKPVSQDNLQGHWKQAVVPEPLGTDEYEFWITNDSFKMKRYSFTDALYPPPCDMGWWYNYAVGKISINGSKVTFNGIFTDENFEQREVNECGRLESGPYHMQAESYFIKDTLVFYQLKGNAKVQNIKMRKQ